MIRFEAGEQGYTHSIYASTNGDNGPFKRYDLTIPEGFQFPDELMLDVAIIHPKQRQASFLSHPIDLVKRVASNTSYLTVVGPVVEDLSTLLEGLEKLQIFRGTAQKITFKTMDHLRQMDSLGGVTLINSFFEMEDASSYRLRSQHQLPSGLKFFVYSDLFSPQDHQLPSLSSLTKKTSGLRYLEIHSNGAWANFCQSVSNLPAALERIHLVDGI